MSTDQDRIRIRQLDDKSDYSLWRIRVTAIIDAKGLADVFSSADADPSGEHLRQASNIIVSTLSDQALRVVRSVIGKPEQMLAKLDSRYDSKSTASKIAKVSELVSTRYSSLREDMSVHVDRMAGLIEQLKSMGMTLDESLSIGILVASIEVQELMPVTASIKTLSESDVKWEEVSNRLIEDSNSISSGTALTAKSNMAHDGCQICHKSNHRTEKCFLNPMSKNSKLNISDIDVSEILEGRPPKSNKGRGKSNKGRGKTPHKPEERSAMARHHNNNQSWKADRIMLDSGTTTHITPYGDRVENKKVHEVSITLADESTVSSSHCGVRKVKFMADDGPHKISLSKTLVVPNAGMSLLSVPALTKKDIGVFFMPGFAVMYDLSDECSVLGYAEQDEDGLYFVRDDGKTTPPKASGKSHKKVMAMMAAVIRKACDRQLVSSDQSDSESDVDDDEDPEVASAALDSMDKEQSSGNNSGKLKTDTVNKKTEGSIKTWHLRLGHALPVKAVKHHVLHGLLPHVTCKYPDCKVCLKGKFRRRFDGSITNSTTIGTLHVDTKGKVEIPSIQGHKYFVTIVEEFSRFVCVCPIRCKADAADKVLRFIKYFEKQSGHTVRRIHADGGTEFTKAIDHLRDDGLNISITAPYTPESNGLAERTHQTVLSLARTCLQESKIPEKYWSYAVRHVVDCRNFVRHQGADKSPFEILFGRPSTDLTHIRPFGCHMVCRPPGKKLGTFSPRAVDGLCLYHESGGLYQVLTAEVVVRSKHVRAMEMQFPGLSIFGQDSSIESTPVPDEEIDLTLSDGEISDKSEEQQPSQSEIEEALTYVPPVPSNFGETDEDEDEDEYSDEEEDQPGIFPATHGQYGLRPRNRSNFICMAKEVIVSETDEPKLAVALRSSDRDKWIQAIQEEFKTIKDNGTWTDVDKHDKLLNTLEVLPSGMVLRIKRDATGKIARYKARLVVRGNLQSNESDYAALYAPVACIELVRLMLSISVAKDLHVDQLDVKSAFLHAALPGKDRIFIKLPKIPGVASAKGQTVRLRKSLYGLREAPKLWYRHLTNTLGRIGLVRSNYSDCLFVYGHNGRERVYVVAYVDDLLVIGSKVSVDKVKKLISKHLTITDLGQCSSFLGIKMNRRDDGLFLSQGAYTSRVLEMAKMSDCKPTSTPLPMAHSLYRKRVTSTEKERQEMTSIPYRQVLGSLIYLSTRTRPDISTAVSMLGKFQADPTIKDWKALKHLLRYLKGTLQYGLLFPFKSDHHGLQAWSDADWARDEERRRSRTGMLVLFHGSPVSWASKMQTATAMSTAEAEFAALASTVREVVWIQDILHEVGFEQETKTAIMQDNLGAISWTEDVQGLRRVKHVGLRYHFVRDMVSNGKVEIVYTPTDQNRADAMTKILGKEMHSIHRRFVVTL